MNINFIPSSKEASLTVPHPKSAKNYLPEWYTEQERFFGGKPKIGNGKVLNNSLKSCVPFYDSMISGYVQETWCDIYISFNDKSGEIKYNFSSGPEIISLRSNPALRPLGDFYPHEFVWMVPWMPKVPKGWSVLFKHPSNRVDLPFVSLEGIVDSDDFFFVNKGRYPFYVKNIGTELFIPKGTPMYQMIPIKRENWKSSAKPYDENQDIVMTQKLSSVFISPYKRFFHTKKSYL